MCNNASLNSASLDNSESDDSSSSRSNSSNGDSSSRSGSGTTNLNLSVLAGSECCGSGWAGKWVKDFGSQEYDIDNHSTQLGGKKASIHANTSHSGESDGFSSWGVVKQLINANDKRVGRPTAASEVGAAASFYYRWLDRVVVLLQYVMQLWKVNTALSFANCELVLFSFIKEKGDCTLATGFHRGRRVCLWNAASLPLVAYIVTTESYGAEWNTSDDSRWAL